MRLETFEMIDRVVALDLAGRRIEASATVPTESPVFEGHFPGHPLMPGVLLTETMAQASGYLVLAHLGFRQMPFLMGIDRARFRRFVGPGTALSVTATLEHDGSGYAVTRATVTDAEGPLCGAELRFKTMPFPAGLDAPMRARARAIGLPVDAAGRGAVMARTVVVTGIGIVTAAGEGADALRDALAAGQPPPTDTERFAPYPVHPVGAVDYDRQIPRRADQRAMEPWQRLGVHAAGLALDDAGAKDDAALKARVHLIVAAGGGERDYAVDGQILTGLRDAPDPGAYLNESLTNGLRPTLFLAQLSNLLAGNIAIVHGVTAATRTFMGEEAAGTDALRVAHARIAAGQADAVLVGGSYNAERPDAVLIHALGGVLHGPGYAPVAERGRPGGFILGSGAAFVLLEAAAHAAARGARARARLAAVESDRPEPGALAAVLERLFAQAGIGTAPLVLSAATGVADVTEPELSALAALAPSRTIVLGDLAGHLLEGQAPLGTALATALLDAGEAEEAVVSVVGHRRGAGVVRLLRAR